MLSRDRRTIAYFSMELMLSDEMPTYSGGLGALAGDTLLAAADLGVPVVAVSLLHRSGYFRQRLDERGGQSEETAEWRPEELLERQPERVTVQIEGRAVAVSALEYLVRGRAGGAVPVYLLDTDLPHNTAWDRTLTHELYGGDARYRLAQEAVLGIGGVRMLRALGFDGIERFHLNEGHSALLALELLAERSAGRERVCLHDVEAVWRQCVFTTHTPVPAGHDRFPREMATEVLGHSKRLAGANDLEITDLGRLPLRGPGDLTIPGLSPGDAPLNMTQLALNLSHYVNGVAKRHGEVASALFGGQAVDAITNGVHWRWMSAPVQRLLDAYLPDWRRDNFSLRGALNIPCDELREAHEENKRALLDEVRRRSGRELPTSAFTVGFARRMTPYKRPHLVFHDLARLRLVASRCGPLQLVFAGKAHPRDEAGKRLIARVIEAKELLRGEVEVVYLEEYDARLARLMTAGVDLWLNTPAPPNEASGTSGMKAALNGVPSLSVLDGWWLEGHIGGMTGWAIGSRSDTVEADLDARHADSIYDRLETEILPLYYREPDRYSDVMRHGLAVNGSFFNAQRMLQQYVLKAYFD
jgi:starch phosphorylase